MVLQKAIEFGPKKTDVMEETATTVVPASSQVTVLGVILTPRGSRGQLSFAEDPRLITLEVESLSKSMVTEEGQVITGIEMSKT